MKKTRTLWDPIGERTLYEDMMYENLVKQTDHKVESRELNITQERKLKRCGEKSKSRRRRQKKASRKRSHLRSSFSSSRC